MGDVARWNRLRPEPAARTGLTRLEGLLGVAWDAEPLHSNGRTSHGHASAWRGHEHRDGRTRPESLLTISGTPAHAALLNDDDPAIKYSSGWQRLTNRAAGDLRADVHGTQSATDTMRRVRETKAPAATRQVDVTPGCPTAAVRPADERRLEKGSKRRCRPLCEPRADRDSRARHRDGFATRDRRFRLRDWRPRASS